MNKYFIFRCEYCNTVLQCEANRYKHDKDWGPESCYGCDRYIVRCEDCGSFMTRDRKASKAKYCWYCAWRREKARKRHWANNKRIKERTGSAYFNKMALSVEKWRYEKELASFRSNWRNKGTKYRLPEWSVWDKKERKKQEALDNQLLKSNP